MANWKRALIFGSMGAGVALFVSGRRAAGSALAGVGVGVLVYENRETLQRLANDAPQYLERGKQVAQILTVVGQKLMEARRA